MRLAETLPVRCSACFGQKVGQLHVDFEAAWDGPILNDDGMRVSIDDLFICEECLRDAAALLPENAEVLTYVAELEQAVTRWEAYAERMQDANRKLVEVRDEKPAATARKPRAKVAA